NDAIKALDQRFGDLFRKKTARKQLDKINQNKQTFEEFYRLFRKYAIRAKVAEDKQLHLLRQKLSPKLAAAMASVEDEDLP
ncbi:hypothetical protein G3565_36085, partial [Escherichia coli]|nr:hypothetical protein [Escherichia coli]